MVNLEAILFRTINQNTVEPQLSEPNGRHTIWSNKRGVQIDEGNRNSLSVVYQMGDNWKKNHFMH